MLRELVEKIVEEQKHKTKDGTNSLNYPVDICLINGNIILRAFRIVSIEGNTMKGITWKEEYSAPRENRSPVFSYFEMDEIASLHCFELDIEYQKAIGS
jgi:hypothetical protein